MNPSDIRILITGGARGIGAAIARRFRDEAGFTNQAVAQAADSVIFVAAGLPLTLKPQN